MANQNFAKMAGFRSAGHKYIYGVSISTGEQVALSATYWLLTPAKALVPRMLG